jgi:hypothetical protein
MKRRWEFLAVVALALTLTVGLSYAQNMGGTVVTKQVAGLQMKPSVEFGAALHHDYEVRGYRGPVGHQKLIWVEKFRNRTTTLGLNNYINNALVPVSAGPTAWYIALVGPTQTNASMPSTAVLTSSTVGAFTAADVGQPIVVQGAGTAGADLYTTVLSLGSSIQVTLNASAATNVSAAGYLIGARTADTAASHPPWVELAYGTYYTTGSSASVRATWTPNGAASGGSVSNSSSPGVFTMVTSGTVYGCALYSASTGTGCTLLGMGPFSASRAFLGTDTITVTVTATLQ